MSTKKKWTELTWDDCPACGAELEAYTNGEVVKGIQYFYDGDEVRCEECDWKGYVFCDEGECWVNANWEGEYD